MLVTLSTPKSPTTLKRKNSVISGAYITQTVQYIRTPTHTNHPNTPQKRLLDTELLASNISLNHLINFIVLTLLSLY